MITGLSFMTFYIVTIKRYFYAIYGAAIKIAITYVYKIIIMIKLLMRMDFLNFTQKKQGHSIHCPCKK